MSISKNNLENKVKYIYELLKSELEKNDNSLKYLDNLNNPNSLKNKSKTDKKYIEYYNEHSINNYNLLIYRNFLLILMFMRKFHKDNTNLIKKNTKNNLDKFILQKLKDTTSLKTQYIKLFDFDSGTKLTFNTFIKKVFDDIDPYFTDDININIENLVISDSGDTDEFKIKKFINYWIDLLKNNTIEEKKKLIQEKNKLLKHKLLKNKDEILKERDTLIKERDNLLKNNPLEKDDVIISIFLQIVSNNSKTSNIPTSMSSFLRYYVYHDLNHKRSDTESVYFSGVGTNELVSNIVNDSKNKENNRFGKELLIGTDDDNEISLQIRKIRYRLITSKFDLFSNIKNWNILDTLFKDNSFDIVVSIPPETLTLLETSQFINDNVKHNVKRYINYNPLPRKNLSSFVHYYNSKLISKNKTLMVVPISFISMNNYTKNLNSSENNEKRNQFTENNIGTLRFKEIVEEQLIKKIMLLPKGMFDHTKEQCVLLEITKISNNGVMLIDGTQYTHIDRNKNVLTNRNPIKVVFDSEEKIYKEKTLVSTYVDYNSIINEYNYNILPSFHLNKSDTTQINKENISNIFKITKSQRFNEVVGKTQQEKKQEIDISFISKSNFNQFHFSSYKDGVKKKSIIKDVSNFSHSSKLENNDILIYSNYSNSSDITIMELHKKEICISNHNLIILRIKDTSDKKIHKKLFLWLLSEQGHNHLLSIVKVTNGKNVLSIEDLKNISINYDEIDDKQFDKIKKKVKSINTQIDTLNKLY